MPKLIELTPHKEEREIQGVSEAAKLYLLLCHSWLSCCCCCHCC